MEGGENRRPGKGTPGTDGHRLSQKGDRRREQHAEGDTLRRLPQKRGNRQLTKHQRLLGPIINHYGVSLRITSGKPSAVSRAQHKAGNKQGKEGKGHKRI